MTRGRVEQFSGRLPEILATIERLVNLESPSSDEAAVHASAELLAVEGARLLGSAPERIVERSCTHLRWSWGAGPRTVLLIGHHDTVWPLGTLQRIPFSVVDGVLRGPGCFDMLTGVAMMLHAVAALPDRDGVTLLITGDEELGSPTSRALIEREAVAHDAVLVLEASGDGGALKTARKGVSQYTVTVHGRASHAGLAPADGINATVELAHQVLRLDSLGDSALGTTVTPTAAVSGTTANTVPASATVEVDVRAWTAAEQLRVDAAITSLAAVTPDARLGVQGGINRPPMEPEASAGLFARAVRVAHGLGIAPLTAVGVGGASDGNFTAGLGVPTLDGLGAVGGGAHGDDEHVLVQHIPERTALLLGLVESLLGESRERDG